MIEAKNLKKIYKPKKGVAVSALDDVSVKLPDKGMVFILGKSGSGKSTLLNVLGGLDSVDSGEIVIKGVSAKDFKQAHYDSYRNTYVGFIFQEYNILEEFTVGANVALAIELQGRKPTSEEINKILKKVDLEGYGNRKPNELSGGQKQRVAIARALVKNPEIIMADEPTGALDSVTGRQVFDTLKSLSKEKLVLIVSHDREFSELYADRIIELADGKIISDVEKVGDGEAVEVKEESLTYNANEIEIKKGYVLTEKDLADINAYIASLTDDAKLIIKGDKRPDASGIKYDFVKTDESKINIKKDDNFRLIKSKLSLKNAFKIGASGLKHKKVRLVFTIFLSFIAFALFGLADTVASYDNVGTAITSLIDSNIDYASFQKKIDGNSRDYLLSEADIEKINESSGVNVTGVYKELYQEIRFDSHYKVKDAQLEKRLETLYVDSFSGFAEITESDLQRYGYTITGKMPEAGKKEIAISKYIYDSFVEAGFTYIDTDNEEITMTVTSPENLIGKKLKLERYGEFTITGVIDTKFDVSRYESLLNESDDAATMMLQMALSSELYTTQNYSMNCVAFVSRGTIASIKNANNDIGQQFHSFGYMEFTNRPENYNGDNWDKFISYSSGRIARLNDISMPIIWLNGEKTSLATGEFIISSSALTSFIKLDREFNLWDEDLKGYELTLKNSENGIITVNNLNDVLYSYNQIAAYKYASQLTDDATVKSAVKQVLITKADFGSDYVEQMTDSELISSYMGYCHRDPSHAERAEAYASDVYTRYELEGKVLDLKKEGLWTSITVDGETHTSGSRFVTLNDFSYNYEYPLFEYYVYSHYEDAKAYYKKNHPNATFDRNESGVGDKEYAHFYNVIQEYRDSFYEKDDSGSMVLSEEIREFAFEKYMSIFSGMIDTTGVRTRVSIYSPSYEDFEYEFKIVGIAKSSGWNDFVVGSNELYSKLLGGNADGVYAFAVAPMPSDRSGIEKVVKFSYKEFDDDITFGLANSVTYELDMIDEILDTLGQIFLYVGLALAVFASLMLSNFIATSVSLKKQEIGILRAIGSRSNDVFRIFFAEAFIIAMINFLLAIVTTGVTATVINSILREDAGILVTILSFGVRQIGLLLLVSLFVAFVSTFFPVKKIASKKPIDAIRKR